MLTGTKSQIKAAVKRAAGDLSRAWVVDDCIATAHFILPLCHLPYDLRDMLTSSEALAAFAGLKKVPDSAPSVDGVRAGGRGAVAGIEKTPANTYARTPLTFDLKATDGTARLYRCEATGDWTAFDVVYLAALGNPEVMYMARLDRAGSPDPEDAAPAVTMPLRVGDHIGQYLATSAPETVSATATVA